MDTFALAALLLFITGGVTAQVQLEPQSAMVLQSSDARFNCSTRQQGWTVMIWSLNGRLALTILEASGMLNSSSRFSGIDYSTTGESKWEFIIKDVSRNDSGEVSCQIQGSEPVTAGLSVQESGSVEIVGMNWTVMEGDQVVFQCLAAGWFPTPQLFWTVDDTVVDQQLFNTSSVEVGTLVNSNSTLMFTAVRNVSVVCLASIPSLITPLRSSVFLVVEKVEKPAHRDQTVLIAVTVSISAVALLVLIITAIVLCCKRRKRAKTNYQEEVRAHARSPKEGATHPGEGQGQDNLGYVTDPKANDTNSEYTDSGFWQSNYISTIQVPDVVKSNQEANNYHGTLGDNGVRKHRHVTIV
ncbi:immunoglobulin superfamily member 5 isoform X1 [Colossoma macropomum]|uniref:immunoglobulin superfamily member 5 isoform X1 n=1 Tax=Colossoma macropomum TaxID=42526 RepID=UPI001863E66A|nr:immunoglobulin superfamily member 5 isoform X1 [Colossoma macropomum]